MSLDSSGPVERAGPRGRRLIDLLAASPWSRVTGGGLRSSPHRTPANGDPHAAPRRHPARRLAGGDPSARSWSCSGWPSSACSFFAATAALGLTKRNNPRLPTRAARPSEGLQAFPAGPSGAAGPAAESARSSYVRTVVFRMFCPVSSRPPSSRVGTVVVAPQVDVPGMDGEIGVVLRHLLRADAVTDRLLMGPDDADDSGIGAPDQPVRRRDQGGHLGEAGRAARPGRRTRAPGRPPTRTAGHSPSASPVIPSAQGWALTAGSRELRGARPDPEPVRRRAPGRRPRGPRPGSSRGWSSPSVPGPIRCPALPQEPAPRPPAQSGVAGTGDGRPRGRAPAAR